MLTLRKSEERGHFNHGWLNTKHSFSFARYYDPAHMGFRGLRVINEDTVLPGQGFGAHPHNDMEIVSIVLAGEMAHKDSMGTGSSMLPGDVQRMSAGTGLTHSEFNASQTDSLHFMQIWIEPISAGIAPSYEQKRFTREEKLNRLRLVLSPDGREGSVSHHSETLLHQSVLEPGHSVSYELPQDRHAWIQVLRGRVRLNGQDLSQGDGASTSEAQTLSFEADEEAEFLLFDLG